MRKTWPFCPEQLERKGHQPGAVVDFSVGRLGLGGLRDRLPREGISEKAAVPLTLAPSSRLNALIYPHKTLKDQSFRVTAQDIPAWVFHLAGSKQFGG